MTSPPMMGFTCGQTDDVRQLIERKPIGPVDTALGASIGNSGWTMQPRKDMLTEAEVVEAELRALQRHAFAVIDPEADN